MTQHQLDCAVARSIGDPVRTVHRLGFSPVPDRPAGPDPEELYLALNCPHCKQPVLFPGQLADGTCPLAECPDCDALFGFDLLDVYVAAAMPSRVTASSPSTTL